MNKKEIQKNIVEKDNSKATEEEFFAVLRTIAPGTNFRAALDGSLRAGKGALIVVENENTTPLFDGGFRINTKFTPQRIIELSKMDGAIILSHDTKRINQSNVLLTPSSKISSNETGTRHKAAERVAKQAGTLTIAISERRHEITIFYKNIRYVLVAADELLRKANENTQLLEKQRELFDSHVERLDMYELSGSANLHQAINVIQKGRIITKISEDLSKSLIELGKESTLLKMRLKEITLGVEKETDLVIKDYTNLDMKKSRFLLNEMTYDSVLDEDNVAKILGYENASAPNALKGWRLLSRTSLSDSEIASLLRECLTFNEVLKSDADNFKSTLDESKAEQLKLELGKIRVGM
ncbi:MAG: DNA integrity scanning diadenylate cyclase DisA [Nanoarchaeota archaeon]|nr:DNA integrity scanning diadenylate cyclase DisA [Nanoarchaeota archaeon]